MVFVLLLFYPLIRYFQFIYLGSVKLYHQVIKSSNDCNVRKLPENVEEHLR